jgi:cupin superfamily acireductone dioxygenase involved in methionine salvage
MHLVLAGDGSFWFADEDGPAAEVVLEPGDVIGITGTEHRYQARSPQAFLVRHSAAGDMTPTPTGRP